MTNAITAYATHIWYERLGGTTAVHDENTGRKIGQCDIVKGFAHYIGVKGSAHEGVSAVIRGGIDGLTIALRGGLRGGRDDRTDI